MENSKNQKDIIKAFHMAEQVRCNSYSPYSKFKVGTCIKTVANDFFVGTNVENASFGATICAERSAIMNMIASVGVQKIEFLLVTTSSASVPCGMCLQVMAEFLEKDSKILITDPIQFNKNKTPLKIYILTDLLRIPFDKEEFNRVT